MYVHRMHTMTLTEMVCFVVVVVSRQTNGVVNSVVVPLCTGRGRCAFKLQDVTERK